MPTRHRRINVVRDPELAEALARVRDMIPGPESALVRAMALRGVEATLAEERRRAELVERFIARTTASDWPPMTNEELDQGAWGIGAEFPERS